MSSLLNCKYIKSPFRECKELTLTILKEKCWRYVLVCHDYVDVCAFVLNEMIPTSLFFDIQYVSCSFKTYFEDEIFRRYSSSNTC